MPRTIVTKDYSNIRVEAVAAAALSPGHILEWTSAGKVQKHSSAGLNVPIKYIAVEDDIQGNEVDTAYSSASRVLVAIMRTGDEGYVRLKNGENVSIGDLVESDGAGQVQKYTADAYQDSSALETGSITVYPTQIIGQCLEAVDMSDSSAADPTGWLKIRFIG